ncbi:MAG: YdcF family protein [Ignavibacteria bacterium]|nr:YdcF family protein [Ignavibacteria bacterium]
MGNSKTASGNRLIIFWLICYEIFILLFMEAYKYWLNSSYTSMLSRSFLSSFVSGFNILYTGNLFWITICLIAIIAIINIALQSGKVNRNALRTLVIFSVISLVLLAFAFFQGRIPRETFYENLVTLSQKGIQTITLSIFAIIHLFIAVSACVISFTVLMKFYIFRSIWVTLLIMAAAYGIVFLFAYNYKDDFTLLKESKKTVDAGTVLGAAVWGGNRPSPVLRERINKGYELYSSGTIKNIILTGGGAPGEMTEAEVSKNELLKKGVPERNIFIENKSNSTLEQIQYLNNNLYKKNNWKDIVIISDNFHLLRTKQICKFFGVNAYTVASETPLSTESSFNFCIKESFAVILFWLFGIG